MRDTLCGRLLQLIWLCAVPVACLPCTAADLLRLDGLIAPKQAPAGVAVPFSATFTVLEPISAGWRVGADLIPAAGGPKYSEGPANSPFGPATETGATRTVSFSVAVPSDAAPGIYRIAIDHYTKRDDRWVHVRYQDADGKPQSVILGELEIIGPLAPAPAPARQRRLRAGEIHRVLQAEDFEGMDGGGEDLGVARGWTWYSHPRYAHRRAAVNTTGTGTVTRPLTAPLPAGDYRVLVSAQSPMAAVRISLGESAIEGELQRSGWNDLGTLAVARPVSAIALTAVRKPGQYVIVDAVYVTNDLSTVPTSGLDPSRQFLPADAKPTKSGRTIYTESYMAGVRARMARYPEVAKTAADTIERAREIAAHGDEALWGLLADTTIKREYYVNQNKGCPVCGLKIKEFDAFHPWIIDPFERPYKMQCPSCNTVFPSNDFAAGELTGGEYPDDGTGFRRGEDTYSFIGEYVHEAYRKVFVQHLRTLTEATALTGDPALTHKLGVMLLRAAQQWPNSEDRADRAFKGTVGYASGAITDLIWSSYEGRNYGCAYDAAWPFLDADEELLTLARREIPEIQSHEDLRLYIEENLLRRIGQMYCDGAIQGNAGYHHAGMAWLLLALGDMGSDRFPDCTDLLEFLYYRIFGPVRYLPNLLGRDGCSYESTGYNASRLNMVDALRLTERFFAQQGQQLDRGRFPSLCDDPRFAAQFDYYTDYILLDRWLPSVGDANGGPMVPERTAPNKLSVVSPAVAVRAWEVYKTPTLARLAYGYEDTPPAPSLWDDLPVDELAEARKQAPDEIERHSGTLDDYGLAFLRSGEGDHARVLWAWYGQLLSHAQGDKMMYGLCGLGLDLLPDPGYPKSWEHAGRWESHSLSTNTITVDGKPFPAGNASEPRERGRLTLLGVGVGADADDTPDGPCPFQVIEIEGGDIAGDGEIARRLLALIDIDEQHFYTVDMFDIRAGSEHTLSYHGPRAEVTVSGIELQKQPAGTVAGPDIEYGQPLKGADGKDVLTPLSHMTEVERGSPSGPFTVDYALGDEADTHVAIHMLPPADTRVAFGTGSPPSQPDAYTARYCLQTRTGVAPLQSRYVAVVAPRKGAPVVTGVERLAGGEFGVGEVLKITHRAGYDILLLAPTADTALQAGGVSLTGRCGLVRFADTRPAALCGHAFVSLQAGQSSLAPRIAHARGTVAECDYGARQITVKGADLSGNAIGRPVRIYNQLHSSMHIIEAVEPREDGAVLTLSTTALRHDGWVSGITNGSIRDGAPSPWALDTFLTGTRLLAESGQTQWMVAGARGGWHSAPTGTTLFLAGENTSASEITSGLADADGDGVRGFRIYEYGVGDSIELVSFALQWH